jgi:outer membrane immunogenic protein
MKKLLVAGIATAGLVSASAFAADMPQPAPVYKAAPAPVFSWTGFYIGGDVGGVWAKDRITDVNGLNGAKTYSMDPSGVIGGGILGYNVQAGQFVYGLEVDLGGMGLGKKIIEPGSSGVTSNHLDSGFYGDVTGRLGLAFDRSLVYAKGGWAFFDGRANVNNTLGGFGGGIASTRPFTGGWTIGGGWEYAFSPAWSAKIEYLHFDFGSKTATLVTPINGTFLFPNKLTADAVTVGLSYHFGH